MRPEVRALREAAAQAAQHAEVPMSRFLDQGLEEVLEEAESNNWPAQEMAFRLLIRCCLMEGKFNNFQVGFHTVLLFLEDQFGRQGDQVYFDLGNILQKTPNNLDNAIRRWLESNFPDSMPRRRGSGPPRR